MADEIIDPQNQADALQWEALRQQKFREQTVKKAISAIEKDDPSFDINDVLDEDGNLINGVIIPLLQLAVDTGKRIGKSTREGYYTTSSVKKSIDTKAGGGGQGRDIKDLKRAAKNGNQKAKEAIKDIKNIINPPLPPPRQPPQPPKTKPPKANPNCDCADALRQAELQWAQLDAKEFPDREKCVDKEAYRSANVDFKQAKQAGQASIAHARASCKSATRKTCAAAIEDIEADKASIMQALKDAQNAIGRANSTPDENDPACSQPGSKIFWKPKRRK